MGGSAGVSLDDAWGDSIDGGEEALGNVGGECTFEVPQSLRCIVNLSKIGRIVYLGPDVYLSQRVLQTADPGQQHVFIETIRHGSPIACQHINLLGEYDFSDERLEDSVGIFPAAWLTEQEKTLTKALKS